MSGAADNRTEKPTPRKLSKAREKGQIARSKEVPSATVFLGVLAVLYYFGDHLLNVLQLEMKDLLLLKTPADVSVNYVARLMRETGFRVATGLGPLMLAALLMGVGANVIQGGLTFSWQAFGLRFNKLNPKNGLGRIFSKNGLIELAKGITLVVVVSFIAYRVVVEYLPIYPRLVLMDVRQLLHWTSTITYEVFVRVGVLLILVALGDYAFQRYRFREQMKMTKQEVRDEHKDLEGDALTRGRIRRIQRELARRRMMSEVPHADVVITNPTHYAVALSYKMDSMDAPKLVAKGVGFLALRIKELAQKHQVPLVENKPLAQTLYKTVEIGETIPASLYRAVAEILAYIYKARNAWK